MKTTFSTRSLHALALALAAIGMAAPAQADTKSASATATVMIPLVITKTADLRFGSFAPTATAGSVTIATGGARTGSNVTLSSMAAGGAAGFSLAGDTTATYAITLPSTATLTGAGSPMTISGFTSNPSGTGTLVAGAGTVAIGGTLAVGASQAAGAYTGSFSVTMDYN
jgi:hypothetical protein